MLQIAIGSYSASSGYLVGVGPNKPALCVCKTSQKWRSANQQHHRPTLPVDEPIVVRQPSNLVMLRFRQPRRSRQQTGVAAASQSITPYAVTTRSLRKGLNWQTSVCQRVRSLNPGFAQEPLRKPPSSTPLPVLWLHSLLCHSENSTNMPFPKGPIRDGAILYLRACWIKSTIIWVEY